MTFSQRLKAFNSLVHQLTGTHCVSIVSRILAHNPDRRTHVLDLCTGTGTWWGFTAEKLRLIVSPDYWLSRRYIRVMDIAAEFPSVRFTGIDIGAYFSHSLVTQFELTIYWVPITTRYPLHNVNFELGNINEEFRWPDATFDFIHGRDISCSVSIAFSLEIVLRHIIRNISHRSTTMLPYYPKYSAYCVLEVSITLAS